jgi:hypothetical protein
MSGAKRAHGPVEFASDNDGSDDIPLITGETKPKRSPSPSPAPVALHPAAPPRQPELVFYRVSYTTGVLSSSKKLIRFFDNWDALLFTAEPKDYQGASSYIISSRNSAVVARVELHKKNPHYTLVMHSSTDKEVLGVAWEAASHGPVLRMALIQPDRFYLAPDRDARLGCLAAQGTPPAGCWEFVSRPPPGGQNAGMLPDLPEYADQSERCFVVEDKQGAIVMKFYAMADKFCTIQVASCFDPVCAFGCAIAVIIK